MYSSSDLLLSRLIDEQQRIAALKIQLQTTDTEDSSFIEICDQLASELFRVSPEAQCTSDQCMESERLRTFVSWVVPSKS